MRKLADAASHVHDLYIALYPVLHHSYRRLQYEYHFSPLFILQVMTAVVEDRVRGYMTSTFTFLFAISWGFPH